jgi:zinc protease
VSKILLKLIFVLCVFNACGDEKTSDEKKEEKTSAVEELVSSSGLKFWHKKDDSAPLVHVRIAFKNIGAAHQEKVKVGVPVFYSNAVFCGSGKYSKTQFAKKCSDLSIRISCNAGFDNLRFSLTAPKIVLSEAVDLFNTLITSPNFEEDKIKIIQNGIGYSLQNYAAEPTSVAFFSIIPATIFKSHAYENGKFGSSEDFMKLSIDDLQNYKKQFLITSIVEICVFGDISESEAKSLVDKIFAGIKAGKPLADNVKNVEPKLKSEIKKYYADGPQSSIFFVLKNERPLFEKRYIAAILYRILGEGCAFKGRILSKLRTENGLIYGGGLHNVDLKHASYIFGMLQTDNAKVQAAIDLLKTVIRDLREKGITQKELEFAKNNIKGSLLVGLRTSGDLCEFYFNRKLQGFGTNALSETIEKIDRATLEEVNSFAREILDEITFVVIGGAK